MTAESSTKTAWKYSVWYGGCAIEYAVQVRK